MCKQLFHAPGPEWRVWGSDQTCERSLEWFLFISLKVSFFVCYVNLDQFQSDFDFMFEFFLLFSGLVQIRPCSCFFGYDLLYKAHNLYIYSG